MSVDTPFTMALIAGGCAGTSVDVAMYPIDTMRTRLQSAEGFRKAGGFTRMYAGMWGATLGSSPGAAIFFSTYEVLKSPARRLYGGDSWVVHSSTASVAEIIACFIRVPTEVVKKKMQVGQYSRFLQAVRGVHAEGGAKAFYSGFITTCAREIPFAFAQFPIYEHLKTRLAAYQRADTTPLQGAACGSVGGMIAGMLTTPLDVVNTRVMLQGATIGQKKYTGFLQCLMKVYTEEGAGTLFSGMGSRCVLLSVGGFVFFIAYEKSLQLLRTSGKWE
eukprot:TRINITY_DN42779_c0_g1_i1.p1 TRINITY_DN42779_c0_g1~~TRINITY_DN42779_c0_g1_i1.p1  ORF type:complete len:275 (-),score=32.90 TRINITY_DN42779_c0_g1_i1:397-1221(-)